MTPQSAKATRDLILRENTMLSITLYVLAVLSMLCGIAVLGFAIWRNEPVAALAGAMETFLFIPAWRLLQKLHRERIMIRLLGIGLHHARTTTEVADTLCIAFEQQFRKENHP